MTAARRSTTAEPMLRARKPLTRLVARRVSSLQLASAQRWAAFGCPTYLTGLMVQVVLSGSIAHYPYRQPGTGSWIGVETAGRIGRPVSATAIAQSMRLPPSTVGRNAAALIEGGLLERSALGYIIAPGFFAGDTLAQVAAGDAADLRETLSALAIAGYAPSARAIDAGLQNMPDGVVERLFLAFSLRTLETFTGLYGDYTGGTIVSFIIAANIRHLAQDPELDRRFASEDLPPPDDLREPISLRTLARAATLPFETVRRRVAALVAEGIVVWKKDGVIVPAHVLMSDRYLVNRSRIQTHFDQMLEAIMTLGAASIALHKFPDGTSGAIDPRDFVGGTI